MNPPPSPLPTSPTAVAQVHRREDLRQRLRQGSARHETAHVPHVDAVLVPAVGVQIVEDATDVFHDQDRLGWFGHEEGPTTKHSVWTPARSFVLGGFQRIVECRDVEAHACMTRAASQARRVVPHGRHVPQVIDPRVRRIRQSTRTRTRRLDAPEDPPVHSVALAGARRRHAARAQVRRGHEADRRTGGVASERVLADRASEVRYDSMVRELRRVRVGRRLARLHLLRLLRRIARLRGVPRPRGVARLPPVRSILRRCRLVLVLVLVVSGAAR
mmetsp:Transcript_37558/g.101840  ORF Transcript_37558/g.101840 Transcript_37558/m.101840 type:complete len:273 (-) Transcript_37558:158-976(-)